MEKIYEDCRKKPILQDSVCVPVDFNHDEETVI